MATTTESDITLSGGFDSTSNSKHVQVMQLDMNNDVLEGLLAATRSGKQPQISFGRTPMLRYGARSVTLETRPSKFRPEIYKVSNEKDEWDFSGLISHSLCVEKIKDDSAGLDEAMAVLKNNMASFEKERDARKTILPSNSKGLIANARLLTSQKKATESSQICSPSHSHIDWAIKHRTPAVRYALVHLLALEPQSLRGCTSKIGATKEVVLPILEKIATEGADGRWEMGNKAYKELEPHTFRYKPEQRPEIIEKAIKAYDRLRIDPKDVIWQKLLPTDERNKGKILSRLSLQPSQGTPSMKPMTIDKKTGRLKKPEPKKADLKKLTDSKVKDKNTGKLSPYPSKDGKIDKTVSEKARSASPLLKASTTKRLPSKMSKLGQTPMRQPVKDVKPSATAKSLLNRPRNPSPLSKSPPINASDFAETHPVNKMFSAARSPLKKDTVGSMKRKVPSEVDRAQENSIKRARVDDLLTVSKSKPSPPLKRKADESSSSSLDSTPPKMRKLANIIAETSRTTNKSSLKNTGTVGISTRPRSSTQVSDDSSVTSPDYVNSHSKRLELAETFQRYYIRYKRYHDELSSKAEKASDEQMATLWRMHHRVADMKKQLAA